MKEKSRRDHFVNSQERTITPGESSEYKNNFKSRIINNEKGQPAVQQAAAKKL